MTTDRKIYIVRHGERCDFLMSQRQQNFMRTAFDANGKYTPYDINLPRVLPKRADGWENFARDTPLTEVGYLEAKLTGRAFKDRQVEITHIYCSPALRCVQTAVGLIKGMGTNLTFNIEPGLFEWTYFCHQGGMPSWMQPNEFKKLGYPINTENVPILAENELVCNESLDDYYRRSEQIVRKILQRHSKGNIMLVAHGPSMDGLTRLITGGQPRSRDDFFYVLLQSSYMANIELTEGRGRWKFTGRPVPPLSVSAVATFNPRIFDMSDEQVQEEMRLSVERRKI